MSDDRGLMISTRGWQTTKALTRASELLSERRDQLVEIVGEPKVAERLITISLHSLSEPRLADKLKACDLYTLIIAVREAASMDLMPNGIAGEGWLVPYWNKEKGLYDIQFQAGWRGLQKLLATTAEIASGVVYEHDDFDYATGSKEFVFHKPSLRDRGDRIGAWADAFLLGSGNHRVEIMGIADLEQRRRASKMGDHGAWVEWYDQMARKTVTRALTQRIPQLPPRAQRLLDYEAGVEDRAALPPHEPRPTLEPRAPSAADRARQLLGVASPAGEEDDPPRQATISVGPDATSGSVEQSGPTTIEIVADHLEREPYIGEAACPSTDDAGARCVLEPGHEGNHRNAEKETWDA